MSRNLPSFEVKKLSTIMNELGHKWVDVLKVPFLWLLDPIPLF